MRLSSVVIAIVVGMLLAPAAAAAVELGASPQRLALGRGERAGLDLTLEGVEERGGVFDLFVESDAFIAEFPPDEQRTGIVLLPGTNVAMRWSPTLRMLREASEGEHTVVFRLIERPGPPSPRVLEAQVGVTVAAASPAVTGGSSIAEPNEAPHVARWAIAGATLLAIAFLLRRFAPALVALFWRTRTDRLLEHPVRAAMMAAIQRRPGIHLADLQRDLAIADGQLAHHLRRLVRAGFVQKTVAAGARRLYPAGFAAADEPPIPQRIALALRDRDASAREIAERIGLTPQHARYYLEKMRERGELLARSEGARRVYRLP